MIDNKTWSDTIIKKFDPSFRHRWEIFNELIKNSLDKEKVWVDCGCGKNEFVEEYGKFAKQAIGIDVIDNVESQNNYVRGDIAKLPFPSGYFDLVTLRFVVEHFDDGNKYISELKRVLKKGGKIIILTTNIISPIIFIPKLLLPFSIKNKLLTKIFKVQDNDVFPTFHKLNSKIKLKKLGNDFEIKKIIYISDLNYIRKWMFIIFLIWHKITNLKLLNKFKSNLLVILEKC